MYRFRVSLGRRYDRAALGVVAVSVLALYAAGFAGIELAEAARPDAAAPVAVPPVSREAAKNELPVLTGPAIREIEGATKSVTTPIIVPNTVALLEKFSLMDYRLPEVRAGEAKVPRLYITSLPHDLAGIPSVDDRKAAFIKLMLPLVLRVNEELLEDRGKVEQLVRRLREGKRLRAADQAWLDSMSERYGVEPGDFDGLVERIDIVPPSLALAQAIEESGWGTSRFAKLGNAIFGQWTFGADEGIVPLERSEGKNYKIKAFGHLQESVANYLKNLNRHAAYAEFRRQRAAMRTRGLELNGYVLARTLTAYSQRGEDYVTSIRAIMRFNKLSDLDDARLAADESSLARGLEN